MDAVSYKQHVRGGCQFGYTMNYIYSGNSLKSGVYKITNKTNDRIYIGSAKEFKERWRAHSAALIAGRHSNKFLQSDFNKCGEGSFVFEILEIITGPKENRLLREDAYLEQHHDGGKQCYNFCKKATSNEGRPFSLTPEETRKKQSVAKLGKPGIKGRTGLESGKSKSYDIQFLAPDGHVHGPIHSLNEFCTKHELTPQHMYFVISGKRKSHKGWMLYNPAGTNAKHRRVRPKQSQETIDRRVDKLCGLKRSSESKELMASKHSKVYDIQLNSPVGEIFGPVVNLKQFCLEHGIHASGVRNLIRGTCKAYKGWTLLSSINQASV